MHLSGSGCMANEVAVNIELEAWTIIEPDDRAKDRAKSRARSMPKVEEMGFQVKLPT